MSKSHACLDFAFCLHFVAVFSLGLMTAFDPLVAFGSFSCPKIAFLAVVWPLSHVRHVQTYANDTDFIRLPIFRMAFTFRNHVASFSALHFGSARVSKRCTRLAFEPRHEKELRRGSPVAQTPSFCSCFLRSATDQLEKSYFKP